MLGTMTFGSLSRAEIGGAKVRRPFEAGGVKLPFGADLKPVDGDAAGCMTFCLADDADVRVSFRSRNFAALTDSHYLQPYPRTDVAAMAAEEGGGRPVEKFLVNVGGGKCIPVAGVRLTDEPVPRADGEKLIGR